MTDVKELREKLCANLDDAKGEVESLLVQQDVTRDKLDTANDEIARLRKVAGRYVRAHAGQVVRFQDATVAQSYEDAARELESMLEET